MQRYLFCSEKALIHPSLDHFISIAKILKAYTADNLLLGLIICYICDPSRDNLERCVYCFALRRYGYAWQFHKHVLG